MKTRIRIILSLTVLLLFALNLSAETAREVNETFTLSSNGKVVIDTYKGSINVTTWDKEEVKVHVKIVADESWNGTDPNEQLTDVKIKFKSDDDALYIESDYRNNSSWFGSQTRALVNYTIQMPKTARLVVDDYKSKSEITGLSSKLNFETYKGDLLVTDFSGVLDVETYKGDIKLELNNLTGDCDFETYKGRITLVMPSDSKFSLDADLGRKGDMSSDFDISTSGKSYKYRDHVKGNVNGGGPKIEFETYKGDLVLVSK